jgi:hypothetical protein
MHSIATTNANFKPFYDMNRLLFGKSDAQCDLFFDEIEILQIVDFEIRNLLVLGSIMINAC